MKMKIIIGVIGVIVAGAGIYASIKYFEKEDNVEEKESLDYSKINDIKKKNTSVDINTEEDALKAKMKASENISERHREAGNVIKQSVTNIFNETESSENVTTKNDEKIDKMFDDLNNI